MILGEICVLTLIYVYVAVCRFCAIRCANIICFYLLYSNYSTHVFNILFMFVVLFSCFFSILCILCFCIVLCIVSPLAYSCLFPIFVQVYRPLPPGGNPIAVNKYHIISYHISYHHIIISYHIISYHIISYHIISYHII
jgi:hypothetical protein